jgi:thiol-disulfide isomerase/thioredoxin
MRRSTIPAIAVLFIAILPALAAVAPDAGITSSKQLTVPAAPYDESANARQDVLAAFAHAKQSGKRVLIDFGGNWCPDCRILAAVMELPAVRPFIDAHYEVVRIDVSRFNRNLDVAKDYGAPSIKGVPYLVIAQPDGKILVSSDEVTDEKHTTPQQMTDWLAYWAQ